MLLFSARIRDLYRHNIEFSGYSDLLGRVFIKNYTVISQNYYILSRE